LFKQTLRILEDLNFCILFHTNQLNSIIMFTKSNLVSTAVCAIWAFFGGYLLWPVLGEDFLMSHLGPVTGIGREMPDFMFLALGCVIMAFAMSTIYSKYGGNNYSAGDGAMLGLWIGVLTGFGDGVVNFATSNMLDLVGTMVNGVLYVILFTVMGALAGIVYDKTTSAA